MESERYRMKRKPVTPLYSIHSACELFKEAKRHDLRVEQWFGLNVVTAQANCRPTFTSAGLKEMTPKKNIY